MIQEAKKAYLKRTEQTDFSIKAVLFDMDGVLFDSLPYHASSWMQTMEEQGIPFSKLDVYLNEGRTGDATINDYFQRFKGRKATEEEVQVMYHRKSSLFEEMATITKIPHIEELITEIKQAGKSIFVVTGSGQRSLLQTLNTQFPGVFAQERMVTAFDVTRCKPHPEPYLIALERGRFKGNEAIVVENAPMGVQAGVAAGIFTIGVNTGILQEKDLKDAGADLVYPTMEALLKDWPEISATLHAPLT